MREVGRVVGIEKDRALVEVEKKDECSKCGMCLFPKGAGSITLSAYNQVDAKIGDKVLIENRENSKILGILLVFLVPLLLVGLSVLIAFVIIKNEIWTLFLSMFFIVLWYIFLSLIDNKLKRLKVFSPEILEIMMEKKDERNN